jgi:hypothetical protein
MLFSRARVRTEAPTTPATAMLHPQCARGLHSLYQDSAMFTSVKRCRNCSMVLDPYAAEVLALERELWEIERQRGPKPGMVDRIRKQLKEYA